MKNGIQKERGQKGRKISKICSSDSAHLLRLTESFKCISNENSKNKEQILSLVTKKPDYQKLCCWLEVLCFIGPPHLVEDPFFHEWGNMSLATGKLNTGILESLQISFEEGQRTDGGSTTAMSQETTRWTEHFEWLRDYICEKLPLLVLCIRRQWDVCQIPEDVVELLPSLNISVKFHKAVSDDNLRVKCCKVIYSTYDLYFEFTSWWGPV